MNEELKLVRIGKEYCDYLRTFDERVPYVFNNKEIRPFVGVLFKVNNCKYFAPLSSPKPKHLKIKNKYKDFKESNMCDVLKYAMYKQMKKENKIKNI